MWISPLVVLPRDAEGDHAVRLRHALEDLGLAIALIVEDDRHHALRDLAHRLMEFRLTGIPANDLLHESLDFGCYAAAIGRVRTDGVSVDVIGVPGGASRRGKRSA